MDLPVPEAQNLLRASSTAEGERRWGIRRSPSRSGFGALALPTDSVRSPHSTVGALHGERKELGRGGGCVPDHSAGAGLQQGGGRLALDRPDRAPGAGRRRSRATGPSRPHWSSPAAGRGRGPSPRGSGRWPGHGSVPSAPSWSSPEPARQPEPVHPDPQKPAVPAARFPLRPATPEPELAAGGLVPPEASSTVQLYGGRRTTRCRPRPSRWRRTCTSPAAGPCRPWETCRPPRCPRRRSWSACTRTSRRTRPR